jgi:hypothetical protein
MVTKKNFSCRACGAGLAVPATLAGSRVRCGHCLTTVYVPKGSKVPDLSLFLPEGKKLLSSSKSFYFRTLQIPSLTRKKELRRCSQCAAYRFMSIERCECKGLTTGLDPLKALLGRDRQELKALETLDKLGAIGFRLNLSAGLFLLLTLLYYYFFKNILVALFFVPLYSLILVLFWVACRYGLVHWFRSAHQGALPGYWRGRASRRGELVKAIREYVEPFLERVGVGNRGRAKVPEEELKLLVSLFAQLEIELPQETMDQFIECCVLRRDYESFKGRLERFAVLNQQTVLGLYATFHPAGERDTHDLAFLQQMEKEAGEDGTDRRILRLLGEARERQKVQAFKKDLERLKADTHGFDISIEQVDIMDPYNFEMLVGMIYESAGFLVEETPKSGDQGADVIVIKGGGRTVIQTKLYSRPVSNKAVQEVVAAKAHWNCHRTMVLTNNDFTRSARELAESNKVELIAREDLVGLISEFNPRPKNYGKLALLMAPEKESLESIETVEMLGAGEEIDEAISESTV